MNSFYMSPAGFACLHQEKRRAPDSFSTYFRSREERTMADSIYDFTARTASGGSFDFSTLKDRVILVVNTASKCGFTPQYAGLEELHRSYSARGLAVLGFPCDQFAHQEPGNDAEIAEFCRINYGVSFQIMSKIDVNGASTHPLFSFLKHASKAMLGEAIKWNFTKFLVGKDGTSVHRYAPTLEPGKLVEDIEKLLG
jgi:glutathione peroxidase